jgi:hypothetical protein
MTAEQPGPAACSYRIILSSEFASNTLVHSTPGYIHDSSAQFNVVVAAANVCCSHNVTCGTQPTNHREHHVCAWGTQKEAVQQAALLTLDALHHTWATWPHAVLNTLYCGINTADRFQGRTAAPREPRICIACFHDHKKHVRLPERLAGPP